jgi:hypothetical protein
MLRIRRAALVEQVADIGAHMLRMRYTYADIEAHTLRIRYAYATHTLRIRYAYAGQRWWSRWRT